MKQTLALLLHVAVVFHCKCPEPVSCKFLGVPGQRFTFERHAYVVPKSGAIELISDRHDNCVSDPKAVRVINREALRGAAFGTWTMKLPAPKK